MRSLIKLALTSATLLTASTVMADSPSTSGKPTKDVYFEFDSARLGDGTSNLLLDIVEYAQQHPTAKVVLDGHTDPVGTSVYNVGLSARRAGSVQSKLIAMGVPADRIYRGVYGEDGQPMLTHALDRRVTVWTTEEPLYTLVNDSLVVGTAVLWNKPATSAEITGRPADQVATR